MDWRAVGKERMAGKGLDGFACIFWTSSRGNRCECIN